MPRDPPEVRPKALLLLALFFVAMVACALVGTRGIAYWDAGDYVRQALRGEPSGLLLGRPLFLLISHGVAKLALRCGVSAEGIEPTLRWTWTVVSSTAPPLLALLVSRLRSGAMERAAARDETDDRPALVAGLALAVAPSFAHTAHQVLTDAPALALSILALYLAAVDGPSLLRASLAGTVMGAAIATRETSAVAAISLFLILWPSPRRAIAATTCALVSVFLLVFVARGGSLVAMHGWIAAMRRSAASHPLGAREMGMSLVWLLSLGPLPVIVGVMGLRRSAGEGGGMMTRAERAVVVPSVIATALLFLYPDGSFSPRYFLATAPIALFVAGAGRMCALLKGRARLAWAAALSLPIASSLYATRRADAIAAAGRALPSRLAALPDRALLVPGHLCPAVGAHLAAQDAVAARDGHGSMRSQRLSLICPGWEWPEGSHALDAQLDRARCDGRWVALAVDDASWVGAREMAARDAVRAYATARVTSWSNGWALCEPLAASDVRCVAVRVGE